MIRYTYDIEAYLHRIATLHPRVNKFFRGPFDRYMDISSNRMEWPVLWMEDPTIKISHDNIRYTFHLQLLQRSKEDNWEEQNLAMANLENIFREILHKLEEDAEDGVFDINREKNLEPISGITHSHDVGYQSLIVMESNISSCPELHEPLNGSIFIPQADLYIYGDRMEIRSLADEDYDIGIYNLDHSLIEVHSDSPLDVDISSLPEFFYVTLTYFVDAEEITITNLVHKNGTFFPLIHEEIIE